MHKLCINNKLNDIYKLISCIISSVTDKGKNQADAVMKRSIAF